MTIYIEVSEDREFWGNDATQAEASEIAEVLAASLVSVARDWYGIAAVIETCVRHNTGKAVTVTADSPGVEDDLESYAEENWTWLAAGM
jgi:hypothetical protein